MQSHSSASVPSLIISAISLFEHAEILHTLIGMGIVLHLRLLLRFTRMRRPEFPASDNEALKNNHGALLSSDGVQCTRTVSQCTLNDTESMNADIVNWSVSFSPN